MTHLNLVPRVRIGEAKSGHIFRKSRNHLKILGARRVMCSKHRTEGSQMLGATVGFVHP
jgi:hypothetical protein